MTMIRWNPLPELEEMRQRMDHLLEESRSLARQSGIESDPWQPPAAIFEDERELVVTLDLPGVEQEDIQVQIEGHALRVSGVRRPPVAEGSLTCQRNECPLGHFERQFALPAEVSEERTAASCEQGVLRIVLPKMAPPESKRIEVEVR